MAKQNMVNRVELRGYVFSHDLAEGDFKFGGATEHGIRGTITIATDDDAMNTVKMRFYTRQMTKKGTENPTFTTLKQIITSGQTYEACGTGAMRVRATGDVSANDFYNRNNELVTSKQIRGSFIHFLNPGESFGPHPAFFEVETVVQRVAEKESRVDESEYLELVALVFGYQNRISPVTFSITNPKAIAAFQSFDFPYFGKLQGDIKNTTYTVTKESEDAGFGEMAVQETTRSFTSWDVFAGTANMELTEDTITTGEITELLAQREARLAELANKHGGTPSGFPTAAPKKIEAAAPETTPSSAIDYDDDDLPF